jgi:ectoine hydroxylase-related dioxygenase (phytanoyl-CoA dioxygenase family)
VLKVGEGRYEVLVELKGPFIEQSFLGNSLLCGLLEARLESSMKISGVTAVVSFPGAKLQHVHSDHPLLFSDPGVSASLPSYAINVAVPLIDVDSHIGSTAVFLGSHIWPEGKTVNPQPVIVDFKRGDCVLIDYRTQHAGMPNVSNVIRPILYVVFARPWFFDEGNHLARPSLNMSVEQFMALPPQMKSLLSRAYSQRMRGAYLEGDQ